MNGHEKQCSYCKSKFKFKFPYRTWEQVTKVLYDKAVARFSPIETITFMFNDKPWIIDYTCGTKMGIDAAEVCIDDNILHIYLTEPLTYMQAKEKNKALNCNVWLTPFEETNFLTPDRDLKRLKTISKKDAKLDLDIYVIDVFGDGLNHHCGIKEIRGNEDIKIILEEACNNSGD